jgi:DNA-binding SARP family transcriptional activator/pimeloyl-ACP methyl ester carboxylesterase
MDFRLLGPLDVLGDGEPLPIAAGKQRALLAYLLLNANRTVSRDRIVDALWGEQIPDSAQKMVQIHVSGLRKALPEPRLHTRPPGYLIEVADDELDLSRFQRSVAGAQQALSESNPEHARRLLGDALALWRGPALVEFSEPFARHESARLEELRIAALEWRIEADLALGHDRDVVGELESLLGLYRSGRQAEALAGYEAFRRKLADELGIEPSASLRELQRRILQQDPSLELPTSSPAQPTASAPDNDIAYARSGDVRIAYQIVGDGPLDLVLVHGWVCSFQPGWEHPKLAGFYRGLASLGRLILFDKRGTGLSDRVSPERLPDLETRMDDVRAVMDAAASERAVLLGISEGGSMSALFTATHPQRSRALVLMGTFARQSWAPDYPFGASDEDLRARLAVLEEDDWAAATTRNWLAQMAPDIVDDPEAMRWYTSYVRRGASPGANRAIRLMNAEIDIRDLLPTINLPTLVLYRADENFRARSRFMGEHIPGAQLVELPGNDHLPWEGDSGALLDEIAQFLSALRGDVQPDRVLATLLFIVTASDDSDNTASELLARSNRVVRAQVPRFRGRAVGDCGEGLVATFDGPARAVRCAAAIVASVRDLGLEMRAGVHTGEIERSDTNMRGIAADIGAGVAALARPGEVLVSSTVKDIVAGSGIGFAERGEHTLAGVPGTWRLFAAAP